MTASLEEYLQTVYILHSKNGKVRITDIAVKLDCTKASVNRAIKNLCVDGYLNYETYGTIELTEKGIESAKYIIKKYGVLKEFLKQILEIDEETAEKEAKAMKHAISENTATKLDIYINSIIDIGDLTCGYNPESPKCRACVKKTAKNRINKNKKC